MRNWILTKYFRTVFFLGLLSSPLPYLLLAAFYFFGFAMGMFNNSTGDEPKETLASVSIPAEIKPEPIQEKTYFYQQHTEKKQATPETVPDAAKSFRYFPDPGINYEVEQTTYTLQSPFFRNIFSRPPPVNC